MRSVHVGSHMGTLHADGKLGCFSPPMKSTRQDLLSSKSQRSAAYLHIISTAFSSGPAPPSSTRPTNIHVSTPSTSTSTSPPTSSSSTSTNTDRGSVQAHQRRSSSAPPPPSSSIIVKGPAAQRPLALVHDALWVMWRKYADQILEAGISEEVRSERGLRVS